jgi:DNA-binding winged helix-turn-helix (wHTH) protein
MRLGFGEFIFDSDTRELLREHNAVTLSPKAFQLLEILIQSRPKALSKAELHDRLWPETFVVEANLSNLVGEIRHALSDDPITVRQNRSSLRIRVSWQTCGGAVRHQ